MPKVTADRIVNLRYNDGKYVIPDVVWEIEGENCLNLMINGGGKSVTNQMMMAPFLSGKDRNYITKDKNTGKNEDRRFAPFFMKNTRPTFLIKEFLKDSGSGRFLMTMMIGPVNETGGIDEDDDDPEDQNTSTIRIHYWIEEFEDPNNSMIRGDSLHDKNGSVLTWDQAIEYFEKKRRSKEGRCIDSFDMSKKGALSRLRGKLESLGIDYREKKNMRKFAMVESGLSGFVNDNPSEETLMTNWIIPTAAMRIDEGKNDTSQWKELVQGICTCMEEREQNEETLRLFPYYEDYMRFFTELQRPADEILSLQHRIDRACTDKAAARNALIRMAELQTDEADRYGQQKEQAELELEHTHLEKDSVEYHQLEDAAACSRMECSALRQDKTGLETEAENKKVQLDRLRFALNRRDLNRERASLQEYEGKKKRLTSEAEELEQEISLYGAGIHYACRKEVEAIEGESKELEAAITENGTDIKQAEQELEKILKTQARLKTQSEVYEQKVNTYQVLESETCRKWHCTLRISLQPFQYENRIVELVNKCADQIIKNEKVLEQTESGIRRQEKIITERETAVKAVRDSIMAAKETQAGQRAQKVKYETARTAWQETASRHLGESAAADHGWDTDWLIAQLEGLNKDTEDRLQKKREEKLVLQRQETQLLKEGGSLDEDVRALMESMKIPVQTGADYLRGLSNASVSQKVSACEAWPLLPYSLIMTGSEKERLMAELKKKALKTENLLVLTEMDTARGLVRGQTDVLESTGMQSAGRHIYAQFNLDLLDPEELERKLGELQQKIDRLETSIRDLSASRDERCGAIGRLEQNRALTPLDYAHLLEEIQETEETLQDKRNEEIRLENEKETARNEKDALMQKQQKQRGDGKELEDKKQALEYMHEAYRKASEAFHEKEKCDKACLAADQQIQALRQKKAKLEQDTKTLYVKKASCCSKLENARQQQSMFCIYSPAVELADKSLDEMKSYYAQLQKNPAGQELKELDEKIASVTVEIAKKESIEQQYSTKVRSMPLMEDASESMLGEYEKAVRDAEAALKVLEKRIQDKEKVCTRQETRAEGKKENICSQYRQEPLGKDCLEKNKNYDSVIRHLEGRIQEIQKGQERCAEKEAEIRRMISHLEGEGVQVGQEVSPAQQTVWNCKELPQITADLKRVRDEYAACVKKKDRQIQGLQNSMESYMSEKRESLAALPKEMAALLKEMKRYAGVPEEFLENHALRLQIIQDFMAESAAKKEEDLELTRQKASLIVAYAKRICENIKKIDSSTNVPFRGGRRKLLTIRQPESGSEEAMLLSAERYIDTLYEEYKGLALEQKKNHSKKITPASLYMAVYGGQKTQIYILKPEEMGCVNKPWSRVKPEQSGAERLFASSVVLCSLLYYQRNGAGTARQGAPKWTTMYLDNLFAEIQSEFILTPLFELFNATCTQVITYTNIKDREVVDRFDRIQLLKLHRKGKKEVMVIHQKDEDTDIYEMYKHDIVAHPNAA